MDKETTSCLRSDLRCSICFNKAIWKGWTTAPSCTMIWLFWRLIVTGITESLAVWRRVAISCLFNVKFGTSRRWANDSKFFRSINGMLDSPSLDSSLKFFDTLNIHKLFLRCNVFPRPRLFFWTVLAKIVLWLLGDKPFNRIRNFKAVPILSKFWSVNFHSEHWIDLRLTIQKIIRNLNPNFFFKLSFMRKKFFHDFVPTKPCLRLRNIF